MWSTFLILKQILWQPFDLPQLFKKNFTLLYLLWPSFNTTPLPWSRIPAPSPYSISCCSCFFLFPQWTSPPAENTNRCHPHSQETANQERHGAAKIWGSESVTSETSQLLGRKASLSSRVVWAAYNAQGVEADWFGEFKVFEAEALKKVTTLSKKRATSTQTQSRRPVWRSWTELTCFLLELLQTPQLIRVMSSLITYFLPHFCCRPINMEQIFQVKFEHLCSSY